jgi:hypothetical protein
MSNLKIFGAAVLALAGGLIGCGSSMQPATDRLASTDAAIRSARELGAEQDPQAALHLKLADEQVAQARHLMREGENKRADFVLQRASSDAELAVVLTREKNAKAAPRPEQPSAPNNPGMTP